MTRKPNLRKSQATPDPIPPPPAASSRSARRRTFALSLALLALLAVAWQLRSSDIRLWWLSRQSLETLQKASEAGNADLLTHYAYARRLFDQHRYDQALEAFRAAEKRLPANARDTVAQQTFSHLGFLLISEGNEKDAAGYLKRAQEMNDDDIRVHVGLGLLFVKRDQHLYAENQFKIAVHTDPKFAEGWFYLGKNYDDMRSYTTAIDPLLEATRLEPANPVFWAELGQVYVNLQQYDKAIPALRKSYELKQDNLVYSTTLGSALAKAARTPQEYQEAATLLEESIRRAPDNALAEYALGSLQAKFNNLPEARKHLQNLVTHTPDVADGWYKLAQVEQLMGHAKAYEQANKRFQMLAEYHKTLSVLNTQLGSNPTNPQMHLQRARFLWIYSDLIGALAEYKTALALEPKNDTARQEWQQKQTEYQALHTKNPTVDYHHLHPPPFDEPFAVSPPPSGNPTSVLGAKSGRPQGSGSGQ